MPGTYKVLGTDGFGRSDYRRKLRQFFEVDRHFVAVAALAALAQEGTVPAETVAKAIARYDIDPEKPNPMPVSADPDRHPEPGKKTTMTAMIGGTVAPQRSRSLTSVTTRTSR